MTKLKMARTAVAATSTLVLTLGVVGFASAHRSEGGWGGWRGDSSEIVTTVENDNDVALENNNDQYASSGEAEVKDNKEGGAAVSGNATNGNTTGVTVSITNPAVTVQDETSAEDSVNSSSIKTHVDNDNDVHIVNNNSQQAKTGDAEVEGNVAGGNATSGNASNTNSTTLNVTVTN